MKTPTFTDFWLKCYEKNKNDLLQTVASEAGEGITADEKSLSDNHTKNYGIDFIVITWEQVFESFGAFLPKYAVAEFLVKELRDYLFSPETKQLSELQTVSRVTDMQTALIAMFADFESRQNNNNGFPTGFCEIDNMTGGLHPGELIILASRPSMGKSAFAMNIADHIAVEQKKTTLIFSLEMAHAELAQRMLCSRGRVDAH